MTKITAAKTLGHWRTIWEHKFQVARGCFAVGLYRQGILHDLSKFSPEEFSAGMRYFQGNRSPNNAQREEVGYSAAWLHHKGRNKHHYEYWLDYRTKPEPGQPPIVPAKMPGCYVVEMFMDRVAASKVYRKELYRDSDPWDYYHAGDTRQFLHPETADLLEHLLNLLKDRGEEACFSYIREHLYR